MIAGLIADMRWYRKGPAAETRQTQTAVAGALMAYHDRYGTFPQTSADGDSSGSLLKILLACREAKAHLDALDECIRDGMLLDAYEQPMRYMWTGRAGDAPAILSAGPDGAFGTGDDVRTSVARPDG